VIKVFLHVGEAVATRWIEMPKGILLLQTVPGDPQSGAIYLYDRARQIFYFGVFEHGSDSNLTTAEFEQLVVDYDLIAAASNPSALPAMTAAAVA
jgi:hypothetical protein